MGFRTIGVHRRFQSTESLENERAGTACPPCLAIFRYGNGVPESEAIEVPTIDYRVETKQLVVGGKAVLLAFPVEKVIEFASGLIVLLDRPPLSEFDRNVLAVSPNGEIVWQIEKPPIYGGHFENPFCEIWFSKNGELLADTSVGATFAVDIKTGRITLRDFQRF